MRRPSELHGRVNHNAVARRADGFRSAVACHRFLTPVAGKMGVPAEATETRAFHVLPWMNTGEKAVASHRTPKAVGPSGNGIVTTLLRSSGAGQPDVRIVQARNPVPRGW